MKKQIFLVSMVASSGIFAGIEWVDEHVPSFEDHVIHDQNLPYDDEDEFTLLENNPDFDEETEEIVESDYILEETSLDQYFVKEEKIEKADLEVAFEMSDSLEEFGENIFADLDQEEEIAFNDYVSDNDSNVVQIAEVGPFSDFKIEGKTSKSAYVNLKTKEEVTDSDPVMVYFAPKEKSQSGFYLSSKKVTNQEYEAFVKATHHRPPPHWLGGKIPSGSEDDPVVNVTYKDAFLYSIWAGKRLPKESELMIAINAGKKRCDMSDAMCEWTSTPTSGLSPTARGAAHLTMNSELSRITYHKVFMGTNPDESQTLDSHSYNNNTGFRTAISTPNKS